ncbi:S-adenosyl-L-methionine-dependent methyltransferase [Gongronella butleri]|nr:S-adenosyl-L-methionine-dependent methyltransferase [Gongronella butleri]
MGSSQSKQSKPTRRQSTLFSKSGSTSSLPLSQPATPPPQQQQQLQQQQQQRTGALKAKPSFVRPVTSSSTTTTSSTSSQAKKKSSIIQTSIATDSSAPPRPPLFAGLQSNSFFLPKDWQAENADQSLHFGLKLLFPLNVLPMVMPKFVKQARIVDVGCRQGTWILDMASQFAECEFIGLETSMTRLPSNVPPLPNVSYQLMQADRKLPFEDASVDLIQTRAQNMYMDHDAWQTFLTDAHRVLKPGGFIHIVDYIFKPSGSVLAESFSDTIKSIFEKRNRDSFRPSKLGAQLPTFGFQVVQTMTKKVPYSNDKMGQLFTVFTLHRFEESTSELAPELNLSVDDYRQRCEMVMAQCVNCNDILTWHAFAARKV